MPKNNKIYIESDMFGSYHIMHQAVMATESPVRLASVYYNPLSDNLTTKSNAIKLAIMFGSDEEVEIIPQEMRY